MEEALRELLASDAGVATLVGESIQWGVREGSPCIVLHLISAPADPHLKGKSSLVQARVQIDCVADTFLAAKAIGVAVEAAAPAIRQVVGGTRFQGFTRLDLERARFGEAPNIFHRTRMDFRVSYSPA